MDSEEWWWLYDAKAPSEPGTGFAGNLDADTVADLYDWVNNG